MRLVALVSGWVKLPVKRPVVGVMVRMSLGSSGLTIATTLFGSKVADCCTAFCKSPPVSCSALLFSVASTSIAGTPGRRAV